MPITLPEITVVGVPGGIPITVADWFAEGFTTGWRSPDVTPEAPAPLDEEAMTAFFDGTRTGASSRRDIESQFSPSSDGLPGIEPEIGGRLFEEVQREWDEAWAEFLEHQEAHIEVEKPEIVFSGATP
jgi:hypothetical protein